MAQNIKGITLEIGATTDKFKKAMKDMSSATRSTQNELNAVNKQLKFDPKNVDLLKQKEELLAKQIEDVRLKVEKMKEAKAKADKEMANGTEINQENYRVLVREISAAEGQLKSLVKESDKFGNSAKEIGNKMQDVGKKGLALTGTIIGFGSAMVGVGIKAAQSADDINTLAKQTGLSTEEIQKFQYASERIDVPLETLTGSMAKLTRNMQSAKNGSKNTKEAFDELGISIVNNEGKLRSNQDVFNEAIDALAQMEDETQRDALAMQIFGKSAQDLNPLILGGSDSLRQFGEEAEKAGLILSQDTLDATNELTDAVDKIKATTVGTFSKIGSEIATRLVPLIGPAADELENLVGKITELDDAQLKFIGGTAVALATVPPLIIGAGKVVTAIGAISTAYKKMAESATVASVASKAIPYVAVAAGAIALIGAVSKLASAADEETKKTKELHEANMQRYEDYQKLKQSAQEQAEASLSEMSHIGKLKDELMLLADENGRVADSDKARAEFILGQLNGALGTEYTMTGNLIQKYGELTTSIDELIMKKKAEIILSSKEEVYKTAVKNIEGQKVAYDTAKSAYLEAEEAFRKYEKGIHDGTIAITRDSSLWLNSLRQDAKEAKDTLTESAKAYDESLTDIRDYEETAAEIIKDGGKKIIEEFDRNAGLAAEKGEETAESFNKGMESVDVETTAKEVGQSAVKALGRGTERDDAGKTPQSLGENVVDGLIKGFDYKLPLLQTRAKQMGKTVITALKSKDGLDVNSPAKPAIPIGEAVVEGLAVGIEQDMSAEEALETKCKNLRDILKDYTDYLEINIKLAESEYDLWLRENQQASKREKTAKEIELLRNNLGEQKKIVDATNDALYYQSTLTGENSAEYKELLISLREEQSAYYELLAETNKAEALKDSHRYSQTAYDLAESEYNLFLAQNPNATEKEKLAAQEKMLTVQYEEQGKKIQDLNDELWYQIQLTGEESEESKALLNQLNEEREAYEELGTEVEKFYALKDSHRYSQTAYDLAESEYNLFLAQNPNATEKEKLAAQEKMLTVQYEEQGKKVQDLNDELWYQIQLTGEESEESKALLIQLNAEREAYEGLSLAIKDVNEEKEQITGIGTGINSASAKYAAYHVQYGALLKSQGVSQEDIDAAARKISGYAGERSINVNNYISGTTPDTAYKVAQETEKTANNLAMQGVL